MTILNDANSIATGTHRDNFTEKQMTRSELFLARRQALFFVGGRRKQKERSRLQQRTKKGQIRTASTNCRWRRA